MVELADIAGEHAGLETKETSEAPSAATGKPAHMFKVFKRPKTSRETSSASRVRYHQPSGL